MGEKQNQPFQLSFNASLKVDFQRSRVTSDGGLILIRELDERLGLEKLIEEQLSDSRQGLNKQFTLADLLRQSVYSRLAGYEDLNERRTIGSRPDVPLNQFAEDLGPGRGADLDLALVRSGAGQTGKKRAVGNPAISLASALVANSLYPGQEKHTMRESEGQIGNSG